MAFYICITKSVFQSFLRVYFRFDYAANNLHIHTQCIRLFCNCFWKRYAINNFVFNVSFNLNKRHIWLNTMIIFFIWITIRLQLYGITFLNWISIVPALIYFQNYLVSFHMTLILIQKKYHCLSPTFQKVKKLNS